MNIIHIPPHTLTIILVMVLGFIFLAHACMFIVLYMLRPKKHEINTCFINSSRHKDEQIRMAKETMRKNKDMYIVRFIYDVVDYQLQFEIGTGLDRYMSRIYMFMFRKYNW